MDKPSREKSWQCHSFKVDWKFVNCTKEKSRGPSRRDFRPQNKEYESERQVEGDTIEIKRGVRGHLQATLKGNPDQRVNHQELRRDSKIDEKRAFYPKLHY